MDEIIHQPLRLKIMAALNALSAATGLKFDSGLRKYLSLFLPARLHQGRVAPRAK
ncbi:hypothetical protein ABH999_003160 [Bradyrhizobium yuanmingense]